MTAERSASSLTDAEGIALAELMDDVLGLSEILSDDDPNWLTDAVAYAVKTDDWLYVKHQVDKHLMPKLIAKAVEKVEAAELERDDNDGDAYARFIERNPDAVAA